ncbi:MAG TPA: isoprenylcysteine carboxylmethyltransferase family protein [Kiritimatiellia bacterium]|nr:isoprenylcysteine carboxylmethyltransferase family protein [Kiritimatiellia bacterium]HMP34767.1 isoprenylcysteine carboxylmethyltransferase family protein [Kiritimatiellia bacterium]
MGETGTEPGAPGRQRVANFAASAAFATASFLAYRFSPHTAGLRAFTNEFAGLSGQDFLTGIYAGYVASLLVFYLAEQAPGVAKSVAAMRGLFRLAAQLSGGSRAPLPRDERLGLLAMLLKGFFAPLMLLSLFEFSSNMARNAGYLLAFASDLPDHFLPLFNAYGFWFLFQLILFLDVFFYTTGYLVEHPSLKNGIRSVDPTLLGWVVVLACYPPFNQVSARLLGGSVADFPQFASPVVHLAVNGVMLGLMALFTSASVALNLKASNLTHRGIVDRGPYRFVRHPAYVAKNLAWWLGSLPALGLAWERSFAAFVFAVSSIAAWNCLYVMRALTEEAHLRSVDGDYEAYCRRVRWRFIPGVI